ncbi:hypothetical protein RclHR1_06370006 [Rhizophagus clarus]|uniref:Uncharacterized protein n=1 Tax=Rhizophagus clarus TaxID=94130 RepID=A0A2Z6SIM2_9GLOM|nr:hypothetical protein RclHR1_06370006 [Rhizophagus clarus]
MCHEASFCSICNSKFQRLKDKDKLTKKLPKTLIKKIDKESDNTFEIDNSLFPKFFDDEYKDIKKIKLYIIVDKRAFQNENIKLADYSISYKAMNARGPSSELEDKCDFDEFIEDYKKVIAVNKKNGSND